MIRQRRQFTVLFIAILSDMSRQAISAVCQRGRPTVYSCSEFLPDIFTLDWINNACVIEE